MISPYDDDDFIVSVAFNQTLVHKMTEEKGFKYVLHKSRLIPHTIGTFYVSSHI